MAFRLWDLGGVRSCYLQQIQLDYFRHMLQVIALPKDEVWCKSYFVGTFLKMYSLKCVLYHSIHNAINEDKFFFSSCCHAAPNEDGSTFIFKLLYSVRSICCFPFSLHILYRLSLPYRLNLFSSEDRSGFLIVVACGRWISVESAELLLPISEDIVIGEFDFRFFFLGG